MIKLETTYRKSGYTYTLTERNGDVCIYRQSEPANYYEVFEVQKKKEVTMFDKTIPAHEAVPSSEQWGLYAYTCYGISAARQKAMELQAKIDRRILR